nr:involucrin [Quercus suber]
MLIRYTVSSYGVSVPTGGLKGSDEDEVKGPQAEEMHLPWVEGPQTEEMHLGWVKGPQAGEIHLQWVEGPRIEEMHLGWVEGPRAREMHAGWVQVSQEYLQPKGLLHVDHSP